MLINASRVIKGPDGFARRRTDQKGQIRPLNQLTDLDVLLSRKHILPLSVNLACIRHPFQGSHDEIGTTGHPVDGCADAHELMQPEPQARIAGLLRYRQFEPLI